MTTELNFLAMIFGARRDEGAEQIDLVAQMTQHIEQPEPASSALTRWRRDPVAFITEVLVDPETGAPFKLYPEQVTFLRRLRTDCRRVPALHRVVFLGWQEVRQDSAGIDDRDLHRGLIGPASAAHGRGPASLGGRGSVTRGLLHLNFI